MSNNSAERAPILGRYEAANRLGVTEQSIIYWEKQGYITPSNDGRKIVYPVAELVAQARKNSRLVEAADKLAADFGLGVTKTSAPAATDLEALVERQQVEIDLLRERVEAQEREIERLHLTLQRLADR